MNGFKRHISSNKKINIKQVQIRHNNILLNILRMYMRKIIILIDYS